MREAIAAGFERFIAAWIPLFVAIDPLGMIPVFLGITEGLEADRRRIARQAIWTASIVAVGFVFFGQLVFKALGIAIGDFQVAAGLILFMFAARELIGSPGPYRPVHQDTGIFPLGMPMIAGPAVLTMLLTLVGTVGVFWTLLAYAVNMLILDIALANGDRAASWFGLRGLRAVAKIVALLLAAIAVHMVRVGLMETIL